MSGARLSCQRYLEPIYMVSSSIRGQKPIYSPVSGSRTVYTSWSADGGESREQRSASKLLLIAYARMGRL